MTGDWSRDRVARAALCRLGEPGDPRLHRMVAAHGAVEVLDRLRAQRGPDGLASDVAQRLIALDPVGDLDRAAGQGIRYVVPGDEEWPATLDPLDGADEVSTRTGAPLGLWVRGVHHLSRCVDQAVAIVGTRDATSYGGELAAEIGFGLSRAGMTVVSGAAIGIDQAAHRGALGASERAPGGAPTVAVLACGVDRAYPPAHRDLLRHIADTGLVVAELAPGSTPTKLRFLARNRIIAGLSRGTVVVEAAIRSGALNTATWTERLNRPLMGVPGPVTSELSAGVHQMIRNRGAALVTTTEEVLELVAPAGEHLLREPRGRPRPHDGLDVRDQQVLDAVPVSTPASGERIARAAGLAVGSAVASLDRLVQLGLVERSGPPEQPRHRLRPTPPARVAAG